MEFTQATVDRIADDFAARLATGFLAIYDVDDRFLARVLLVMVPFVGFQPAVDGVAVANELSPAQIQETGEARLAEMVTASGEELVRVAVRQLDDPNAEPGDVLVDRTDFHRGGLLTLARVTVTVPQ